jgi:hypothetical protein
LPYYSQLSWMGTDDVEWLSITGNFSRYEIDEVNKQVVFYDLQDWVSVVYRTHSFIRRTPDHMNFCVVGENRENLWPTTVIVRYPALYTTYSVEPDGYTTSTDGEIRWDFGPVYNYMVDVIFAGLGPDRPLLDLPVDYPGRLDGLMTGFSQAFSLRTTSKFDHAYPFLSSPSWSCTENPDGSIQYDDRMTDWTAIPGGTSSSACQCDLGVDCYDGHEGYDFNNDCPLNAPCRDPEGVYAAADGQVVSAETGWDDVRGCRITIDHGGGWTTTYAHLQDQLGDKSCINVLPASGIVSRTDRIGTIGSTGSGGSGTSLHFVVRHNGIVVDPSGWEANPLTNPDPWSQHPDGASSYAMWKHSIRTTQALSPYNDSVLRTPSYSVEAAMPPDFYGNPLLFNLTYSPVPEASKDLASTGHSFTLTGADSVGAYVTQLDDPYTLRIFFSLSDLRGIKKDTLSLYYRDPDTKVWMPIPTEIDWDALTATALVDQLGLFALLGERISFMYFPLISID